MSENALSADICSKILQNYINNPNIEYVKSETKAISEVAEGYMGEHLNLDITYKLDGKTLIAKFFMKRKPTKNKVQEEAADETGVYKHEIFLYDFLLKEFEKYGYDTSFASKMYYCIPNEALILENLKLEGFNILERNTSYNMDQIKCLLKNIALFHAAGYAYQATKSKELNKKFDLGVEYHDELQEIFFVHYIDPEAYSMKFWKSAMTSIPALIDMLPRDDSFRKKFKTVFQNYEFGKIFVDETNLKKTCCHGDLWSNNMMFKGENDSLECKLLDFQITRYFYPTFDIILAIYCNTNKEFRDKHLNELYKYYYDTLSDILKTYGYNVDDFLTQEEYYKSLISVKPDAMIQVAFTAALIAIPKEILSEKTETEDGMNELIFGNEEMFVEMYQTDENYRTVVSDPLYELYDSILVKQKI